MNKTISINIGNTNFNINEDAYELLRGYLDSIKKYFHKMDPDHEIVKDIENRIAENFLAKLGENKSSIDNSDVKDLIKIMGTLEDFKEAYNIDEIDVEDQKINNDKRLYRNTSDKIVGGVASGIANHFSIDPLLLRVSFVLATIFGGFGLLIYIICWIAIPGNSAKELVGKKFYRDPDTKIVAGVAAGIANYFNIDVSFIRIFFILSLFIGGFGIIAYFIILVSSKEAITVSEKMNMQGSKITLENIEKFINKKLNTKEENSFVKIILLPFRIIEPILNFVLGLAKTVLSVLFPTIFIILLLILAIFLAVFTLSHIGIIEFVPIHIMIDNFFIDGVNVSYLISTLPLYLIITIYINIILTSIITIMTINSFIKRKRISTSLIVLLFIWFFFSISSIVAFTKNLETLDSENLLKYSAEFIIEKEIFLEEFKGIKTSVPVMINIVEADSFSVIMNGDEKLLKELKVIVENNVLKISDKRSKFWWNNRRFNFKKSITFNIGMPMIDYIKLSTASKAVITMSEALSLEASLSSASKMEYYGSINNLDIRMSSAANAKINGSIYNSDIDMSSGAELVLIGEGNSMKAEMSSAASLDAKEFPCNTIWLDLSSASDAHVQSTEIINLDLSSGSEAYHYGESNVGEINISSGADYTIIN
jgi:phage shock protein PspC (stress-responsive transcriptional regulator)